jgi:hypothetical protein
VTPNTAEVQAVVWGVSDLREKGTIGYPSRTISTHCACSPIGESADQSSSSRSYFSDSRGCRRRRPCRRSRGSGNQRSGRRGVHPPREIGQTTLDSLDSEYVGVHALLYDDSLTPPSGREEAGHSVAVC